MGFAAYFIWNKTLKRMVLWHHRLYTTTNMHFHLFLRESMCIQKYYGIPQLSVLHLAQSSARQILCGICKEKQKRTKHVSTASLMKPIEAETVDCLRGNTKKYTSIKLHEMASAWPWPFGSPSLSITTIWLLGF